MNSFVDTNVSIAYIFSIDPKTNVKTYLKIKGKS